jgi:SAM-dependent methyltransferase
MLSNKNSNLLCRACLAPLSGPFLSLGNQPLSNAYLPPEALNEKEPAYPLDVYHCERCHLVQLPECEKAGNIFNEGYAYFSSYSTSWLKHCEHYAEMIVKRLALNTSSFVLEIASNDGYLLQYFKAKGIPVLGIEPAAATAREALEKGIPTDVCFFDAPYARKLAESGRKADLIAGNNVLAHNPNLREFVQALAIALKPEGVITLEFPHLLQMIINNQFDTVYHEHYSYLSLIPLVPLFDEFGLSVFDVEELPTHGGSLRIYAAHKGSSKHGKTMAVTRVLGAEIKSGLDKDVIFTEFTEKVKKVRTDLLLFFDDARKTGKQVAGYGAPAKGNTLLNYCGIGTDTIRYTVDRSPHKQGMFLPGSHIPIYHPDKIRDTKPDFVLVLPWNIKDEIMGQMSFIREWGGKFVVAVPKLEIMK